MRSLARPGLRLTHTTLITALALLALLQPALGAIRPDLAGRSPLHGHVYRNGVPVPHTHPGEAPAPTAQTAQTGASAPLALCVLHGAPHPIPAEGPKDTTAPNGSIDDDRAPGDAGAEDVGFTFGGPGFAPAMIPPSVPAVPACCGLVHRHATPTPPRLLSSVTEPPPHPPQA